MRFVAWRGYGLCPADSRFVGLVGACETGEKNFWWFDLVLDRNAITSILPYLWYPTARRVIS